MSSGGLEISAVLLLSGTNTLRTVSRQMIKSE